MPKLRIENPMSLQDILAVMSEGNPGALTVCAAIAGHNPSDPSEGLGDLISLDSLGIYGSAIWQLHKDVCGENLECTIKLVRAAQLGFVSKEVLHRAIANYGKGLDLDIAIAAVS